MTQNYFDSKIDLKNGVSTQAHAGVGSTGFNVSGSHDSSIGAQGYSVTNFQGAHLGPYSSEQFHYQGFNSSGIQSVESHSSGIAGLFGESHAKTEVLNGHGYVGTERHEINIAGFKLGSEGNTTIDSQGIHLNGGYQIGSQEYDCAVNCCLPNLGIMSFFRRTADSIPSMPKVDLSCLGNALGSCPEALSRSLDHLSRFAGEVGRHAEPVVKFVGEVMKVIA